MLKQSEQDNESSPSYRHNVSKSKKADNGTSMDIEQVTLKPSESGEPRLHKKVKKEFSDISSIDEERKSECSRLSIEQRLAEIKMEDDSSPSYLQDNMPRSHTYSYEPRNSSLIDELKRKASHLVSLENQKTRSQTAEPFFNTPTSHLMNIINSSIKTDSFDSTKSSINMGMSIIEEERPERPNSVKVQSSNPTLSHYMKNSMGSLVSQMKPTKPKKDRSADKQHSQPLLDKANNLITIQQQQQQLQLQIQQQLQMQQQQMQIQQQQQLQMQQQQQMQQLNSSSMKLMTPEGQYMLNQMPQQLPFNSLDRNPQLMDTDKSRYYATLFQNKLNNSSIAQQQMNNMNSLNLSLLAGKQYEAQQQTQPRFDSNYLMNNQIGGAGTSALLNVNNQSIRSTGMNANLGSVLERTDPQKQSLVKAALDNINANMMLISKIMNESEQQNEIHSRSHSLPLFGAELNSMATQDSNTLASTVNSSRNLPVSNLFSNVPTSYQICNNTSASFDRDRCSSSPFPLPNQKK